MRWLIFGLMVLVTPVAFGGDLTPARSYLERAQLRRAGVRQEMIRPKVKRWPTGRIALAGACCGVAWAAIKAVGAIPETDDQIARLVGNAIGYAVGGAIWPAIISGICNWARGVK